MHGVRGVSADGYDEKEGQGENPGGGEGAPYAFQESGT